MKRLIGMTVDEIREFALREYVIPARDRGANLVEIRAGDVHAKLRSEGRLVGNQISAVCVALGADRFTRQAQVRRVSIVGPAQGANTTFVFEVLYGARRS